MDWRDNTQKGKDPLEPARKRGPRERKRKEFMSVGHQRRLSTTLLKL